ncbi:MAG: Yip1 family protein [Nitrososphaerota archaeon]|nr:Yip1 family protein [Nitrososphaerota archaeon]
MSEEIPRTRIQLIKFVFSKFVKRLVLSIISPRKAIEEIKESPNLLPILILPLILAGLTFLRYYTIFYLKIKVPEPLFNPQLETFFNAMIWINIVQYVFYLLMGLLLVTVFFMLGKWLGGSGDWVQGVSAIGYAHTPNILAMLLLIIILLSYVPIVPTGLVNTVGQFSEDHRNKRIIVDLKKYTGIDSNISVSLHLQYKIPLNATKGLNNTIIGKSSVSRGILNISYYMITIYGTHMVNKRISLNDNIIDSNTPLVLNNIMFNLSNNYKDEKYAEKVFLDLIILLNNTYVSPIPHNLSIPYKIIIDFCYQNETKTYEIGSNFYPDIVQIPDPEPFLNVIRERTSMIEYFLTLLAIIWQTFFLIISFKMIHDFTWHKTALLIAAYIVIKFFVIGFTI